MWQGKTDCVCVCVCGAQGGGRWGCWVIDSEAVTQKQETFRLPSDLTSDDSRRVSAFFERGP